MSDFLTAITATTAGLWWLWLFLGTFGLAMLVGLCRAAAREMPEPPVAEHAPAMPPTLARFFAERAADGIDDEWEALQREIGGTATPSGGES